jgi:hypothetical protein
METEVQSRAFGAPGVPGDFRLIDDMARKFLRCYEQFIDWKTEVECVTAPQRFHKLFECLADVADKPMCDMEACVGQMVSDLNGTLVRVSQGDTQIQVWKPICSLGVDELVVDALLSEYRRVKRRWR